MSLGVDGLLHGQILPYTLLAGASLFGRPRGRRATVDEVWDAMRSKVAPPYDISEILLYALEGLAELLPAEGYYAYVAPATGAPLQLRLTRAETGTPQIGINYAGLVAGAPVRQAPLELAPGQDELSCREDGPPGDPYLSLGLGSRLLLRAALPRRQHVGEPERKQLLALGARLEPMLQVLLALDDAAAEGERAAVESTTKQLASEFTLQSDKLLGLVSRLGGEAIEASAGYCVAWQGDVAQHIWQTGGGEQLFRALDPRHLPSLQAGLWLAPDLPAGIAQLGYQGFALVSVRDGAGGGAVGYGLALRPDLNERVTFVLQSLSQSLRRNIGSHLHTLTLGRSYLESLLSAADLLDAAEELTHDHSKRVAEVARDIGSRIALDQPQVEALYLAGRLHDVGMIAVALDLPKSRGGLSAEGRNVIQQHPVVGANLLSGLPGDVVPPSVVLAVRHHHERWDGQGYPDGRAGTDIDLFARIVACAEVYVARTSARAYRPALSPGRALRELQVIAGSQLDPDVVGALVEVLAARGVQPQAHED